MAGMSALPAAQLLEVWERGRHASPGERALLLLGAAEPGMAMEHLGVLSIGRRDAALLKLRAQTFGERLAGLSVCPQCSEQLEMDFAVADILLPSPADIPPELTLITGDYRIVFRLPNSLDVVALGREETGPAAERWLLQRCIVEVSQGHEARCVGELPEEVIDAIASHMAEADPQAETALALTCPACGVQWRALFDIVAFFWREIDAWAMRILHEVHVLASTYGWSEQDILTLSPWRRQFYLELICA
jgi:T4 bacteriophage base plate protein